MERKRGGEEGKERAGGRGRAREGRKGREGRFEAIRLSKIG